MNYNILNPVHRAENLYFYIFGKNNRIRKNVKASLIQKCMSILSSHKKFSYNYYINKHCPLPKDWKQRKEYFVSFFKGNLFTVCNVWIDQREKIYEEIFSYHTANKNVISFLQELAHFFIPEHIIGKKNSSVLKNSNDLTWVNLLEIIKFVNFNRFETFSKETLLQNFDVKKQTCVLKFSDWRD